MAELASLDLPAILVAAVASAALGAAWYSPVLFGDAWLAALGKPRDQLGSPVAAVVGSVASCLVAATSVELLVTSLGLSSAVSGAGLGLLLGLGVVAMTMLSDSLFSGWGWPLYFIQMSYRATYLVLMGAISGGWPA